MTMNIRILLAAFLISIVGAQPVMLYAQEAHQHQQPLLQPRQESVISEKSKSLVIDGDQVEIKATGKNKRRQKGSSLSLVRRIIRWIGYTFLGVIGACVVSIFLLSVLTPPHGLQALVPLVVIYLLAIPATPFILFALIDPLFSKD
ncbi:MAG TPA: hypothetical protein VLG71_03560 [Candidatus Limnocylindria bacterium]|nr:hypothetical protein [Candidatus Limnocylindria bacterium]